MSLESRVAVLESKMEKVEVSQELILQGQAELKEALIKYKGFLGGIAFVASALVTFITMSKDWFLHLVK